jgi:hypothetical protein
MLTLVFESRDGKKITTYFISIVGIFVATYTLTSVILVAWNILKKVKLRRQKNLKKALPGTIRGGTHV